MVKTRLSSTPGTHGHTSRRWRWWVTHGTRHRLDHDTNVETTNDQALQHLLRVASLIANQLSTLDATPNPQHGVTGRSSRHPSPDSAPTIRPPIPPQPAKGSICEESTLRSAQDLGARSEPGAGLRARSGAGAPAQDLGARSEPGPLAQPQARWLWTRGARVSYSPPLEVFSLEPSHSSRTRPSHHHIMDSSPASPLAPRDPSSPESSIGEQIATLQAQLAVLNFAPSHF
ncbi:BZ3500_MvSof-1268-A1-R1_C132g00712 [Microbotryum saponariae]|uniref:BZ3500_MvSof-1268-A1-R1_C132g00712 protein n=1 Tax=Microbotryum saponariae TaxID=289078 RepID=A0A2X0LF02_9BASI|nr:BZ3500_MvSof-1268-A1-R1_C132g00712 [Microbotryum saponariae]